MKNEIYEFSSMQDFRNNGKDMDLLILDLHLPDGNGLTLAKELKKLDPKRKTIIVTAYNEHVYEGYEAGAFRFILKPVEFEKLREGVLSFLSEKAEEKQIVISNDQNSYIIKLNEIICIESQGRNSVVYLLDGRTFDSKKSISDYTEEINETGFARVHRRYIVNMKHIKALEGNKIIFPNDCRAEISRRARADFDRKFSAFLKTV